MTQQCAFSVKNEKKNFREQQESAQPDDGPVTRRLRAWQLKTEGWSQKEIAAALNVTPRTVRSWLKRATEEGLEALAYEGPGPRPRLTATQQKQLIDLLMRGAEEAGFCIDVWTEARICQVIEREFGIHYSPRYIWDLLAQIGGHWETPEQQAYRRKITKIIRRYPDFWADVETVFDEQGTVQKRA